MLFLNCQEAAPSFLTILTNTLPCLSDITRRVIKQHCGNVAFGKSALLRVPSTGGNRRSVSRLSVYAVLIAGVEPHWFGVKHHTTHHTIQRQHFSASSHESRRKIRRICFFRGDAVGDIERRHFVHHHINSRFSSCASS